LTSRVKVDEDLPQQIADLFVSHGHDAKTVVGQGWQGFPDTDIWQRINREGRWLITADKGFADLRLYEPGSHIGIMLLRPEEESRRAYIELVEAALGQIDLDRYGGAIVVVTHRGLRIRHSTRT
jgi:predicted nuclease of predicted toxin-antitoxin system